MDRLTRVRFTNLNKVLYPATGVRKLDVIKYYIQVAPKILPFLEGRALMVNRFPDGVEAEGFYGKDAPQGVPEWVKLSHSYSESAKRELDYIICNDLDTLLWLANLASLELHIPLSKIDKPDNPDMIVFDLDPQFPAGIEEAVKTAYTIKDKLKLRGLTAWVKTSGKRGLHILTPVERRNTFNETRAFAHEIGIELSKETGIVSSEKGQKKPGTIYLDYPQNGYGRTMVCPYSLRATPTATVSTPLDWSELEKLNPSSYTLNVISKRKDPWDKFWETSNLL
jgi:bifunctional non-homologous end joining protein LigD